MSMIIDLLEKLGQNAGLRYASPEQLAELMANTDPALVSAVICGDQAKLEAILGARTNVVCGVYPAEEPKKEEEPDNDDDEGETKQMKVG